MPQAMPQAMAQPKHMAHAKPMANVKSVAKPKTKAKAKTQDKGKGNGKAPGSPKADDVGSFRIVEKAAISKSRLEKWKYFVVKTKAHTHVIQVSAYKIGLIVAKEIAVELKGMAENGSTKAEFAVHKVVANARYPVIEG